MSTYFPISSCIVLVGWQAPTLAGFVVVLLHHHARFSLWNLMLRLLCWHVTVLHPELQQNRRIGGIADETWLMVVALSVSIVSSLQTQFLVNSFHFYLYVLLYFARQISQVRIGRGSRAEDGVFYALTSYLDDLQVRVVDGVFRNTFCSIAQAR